jgi:hypothetical protein
MMRWISSIVCAVLIAFSTFVSAGDIGTVLKAKGNVEIHRGSEILKAKKKFKVQAGDKVVTGAKDQVFIGMIDKSKMIVRPNSEVLLKDLVYEKKSTDKQETSVLKGGIRAVSGEIAKKSRDNVKFSAGTATIGIRGTDIEVAMIGDGQQDRAGIYNYVHDGLTEMKLETGQTAMIEKEKSGFTPKDPKPGEPLLQILDDRPAFLSGSGFDTLMQQLTNPRVPGIR